MELETKKRGDYIDILKQFPETYGFLIEQKIRGFEKLDSLWRKENLLLRVDCYEGVYVFKNINEESKTSEKDRFQLMSKTYPNLMPASYFFEGNSYLMDYVDGCSFFNLNDSQKVEKICLAGKILNKSYTNYSDEDFPKRDISEIVKKSFLKYRKKGSRFFGGYELILPLDYFDNFKEIPDQPSHNDLNAANLLYGKEIKLIDPSDEGFNDISRDIGRYCASCFFNNYDYFGNDKEFSLEIAEAFLSNFDETLLERSKYYIGESFLSFMNFDTVSVKKSVLKKLAKNLLLKEGSIVSLLGEGLEGGLE